MIDAVHHLVELLEGARPVPFMRNRVRVDRRDAIDLIDAIVKANPYETLVGPNEDNAELAGAVEEVRRALARAYPIPLTDQVRLLPERTQELARALREAARLDS
jgi:hypothetical protein